MKFFDDINVGDVLTLGSHRFTAEEIKLFARQYDPQPFHVDEEAAAQSHFGALCASGWHTASMWMRLRILNIQSDDVERTTRGETNAMLGPSPGFRELKWPRPVYVGDTVTYASEILEKRASQSRPQWGLIQALNTGTNQNGDLVLSFKSAAFVQRRSNAM